VSIDSPRRVSPPLIAVALLSAAALGYEILLMRLFSIILWHHFAYMMISVALLGYGAAGTVVALFQRTLQAAYIHVFVAGAGLFGITAVAGFLLAQRVGFNPLEMLWDPAQSLRLLLIYGLLFIPFLCAAIPICLTFTRFGEQPHRIYSFDIVGAGLGCLGILAALFVMTPSDALKLIGALALLAAAVAAYTGRSATAVDPGRVADGGGHRAGRRARRLATPAPVRLQGSHSDVARRRRTDRR
jgi:hypothetical protein